SVGLTWGAPLFDGGSPITSYTVTAFNGVTAVGSWDTPASATSFTATGLIPGTSYTFTITATNAVGTSLGASTSAVTPVGTPGPVPPGAPPPSGGSAVPDHASATVSWAAPGAGATVTSYTVTAYHNGAFVTSTTVTAPQTTAIVNGLTNGFAYTFPVVANTATG